MLQSLHLICIYVIVRIYRSEFYNIHAYSNQAFELYHLSRWAAGQHGNDSLWALSFLWLEDGAMEWRLEVEFLLASEWLRHQLDKVFNCSFHQSSVRNDTRTSLVMLWMEREELYVLCYPNGPHLPAT